MPHLVFELGTEEMPAGAISSALEQLKVAVTTRLSDARLPAEAVKVFGTPRRLIVSATGVPDRQPDQERLLKGPAKSAAYDANGNPTGAAIGFARKNGIEVTSLEIIETPQGEYIHARITDLGKPGRDAIGPVLVECLKGLTFPKMMRWGHGTVKFVRPVRWILCLLDSNIVPLEFATITSGRTTRGHRFLSPSEFDVPYADELLPSLRNEFVIVDPEERRTLIANQAHKIAASLSGTAIIDDSLLDENVWLVEWPTAFAGTFKSEFLELPRPILVTAMQKHQRYFPVEDSNGKLLPNFIAVRNGSDHSLETVTDGNERVLGARFNDASFFYAQDKQSNFDEMANGLDKLIFQEKLGTVGLKRLRLILLADKAASLWALSDVERSELIKAADLCKNDLVSRMVIELPSLQGVMGREYAIDAGESSAVGDAIRDHYLPKSAGGALPTSKIGSILAVIDRVDTLVGYIGIGILPSGSSDPFGLRRAAQGVIQVLAELESAPSITELVNAGISAYIQVNRLDFDTKKLLSDISVVFDQRLSAILNERGVRYDLVDALLSATRSTSVPLSAIIARGMALVSASKAANFELTVQTGARIANILKSADLSSTIVNSALFEHEEEVALAGILEVVRINVLAGVTNHDFDGAFVELQKLAPHVDRFFDKVMVMVEDPILKQNRLALLSNVGSLYRLLADFTKVVIQ